MSTRIEFRWPDDLVAQIDQARGDVPRTMFVLRAVERALGDGQASPSSSSSEGFPVPPSRGEAPAEQLEQAPVNPPLVPQGPASVQESRAQMFRRATQR